MLLELHLSKYAFTLQFFLQDAQRLVDVIITDTYKHVASPSPRNLRSKYGKFKFEQARAALDWVVFSPATFPAAGTVWRLD